MHIVFRVHAFEYFIVSIACNSPEGILSCTSCGQMKKYQVTIISLYSSGEKITILSPVADHLLLTTIPNLQWITQIFLSQLIYSLNAIQTPTSLRHPLEICWPLQSEKRVGLMQIFTFPSYPPKPIPEF